MKMQTKQLKVDIVSVPFSGHLLPILTIAKPLLSRGYAIRVLSGSEKRDLIEGLGFEHLAIIDDNLVNAIANTDQKIGLVDSIKQFKASTALIESVVDRLIDLWTMDRPDIVVADFISLPAVIACKKLNIKWITTMPSPFVIETRLGPPAYLGGLMPSESWPLKLRDYMANHIIRWFKKSIYHCFRSNLGKYRDFTLYDECGNESLYSPYAILALGMKEIEFKQDFPKALIWSGYRCDSFDTLDLDLSTLTQEGKKLILVTCGNHLPWAKKGLLDFVELVSERYNDYIFLISFGEREALEQPFRKVTNRIYLFKYLPYTQILPHVSFVIHHGGAGILYNCIAYQVPSLIIPRDYDQFDYAARANYYDFATVCFKPTTKRLLKAFEEMLANTRQAKLSYLNQKYQAYDPSLTLQHEIERLCVNGETSN